MRYFQVKDDDGNELGLFRTLRTDEDVETDIVNAFKATAEMERLDPNIDFYDVVENSLDEIDIWRMYVEDVFVDI